ncbi:MAG TPA: biotin/lipoyl-binding protein [Firmicutes bacterium]|nr:biotin/lipoyl-binding protein [Bacillota bacterium]
MTKYRVTIDGRVYEVEVEPMTPSGQPVELQEQRQPSERKASGTPVKSPLAGTILSVKAKIGDQVKEGDVLLTLEALKLENEITAPVAGTVIQIVDIGATVEAEHVLAIIE